MMHTPITEAQAEVDPFVELQKVTHTYGRGDKRVHALDATDLRIERGDFIAVQCAAHGAVGMEAVILLQEAVGIDEETRALFGERLGVLSPGAHAGQVLFGLVLGLLDAQAEQDQLRRQSCG